MRMLQRAKSVQLRRNIISTWGPQVKWMLSGLGKLPNFEGKVWRGRKCDPNKMGEQYVPPRRVQFHGFSSATTACHVALGHLGWEDDGVLFEIKVRSGKQLKDITLFSAESEVLLLPAKSYVVAGQA